MKDRLCFSFYLISTLAALLGFSSAVFSQDQVSVDRIDFEQVNITPIIEYHEDSGRMQGVRDVAADAEGWKKINSNYLNFGYTDSAYWFRFSLNNTTKEPVEYFMEINYPHLKFIDLYEQQGDQYMLLCKTGDGYPFRLRQVFDKNFVFKVKIPPGESRWYFRVYTSSPLKFKVTLFTIEDFIKYREMSTPLYWLYYGVFCIMIILSLFMFIRMRKISYFVLSLFILSLALLNFNINGFSYQYLWPDEIWWDNVCTFFMIALVVVFLAIYVISIVGQFRGSVFIKRLHMLLIVFPGLVLGSLFFEVERSMAYRTTLTAWVIIAVTLLFLGAAWGTIRRDRPSRTVMYSFTMFFAGILVYALMDFSFIAYSDLNEWSIQIGSIMMVFAIMLGITNEIKKNTDDLEASEKRLSTILATTKEGFIEIGDDLTIKDVNDALCDMLGYSRDEVLGRSIYSYINPDDKTTLDSQTDLRKKGMSSSYEFDLKSAKGSMVHVMVNASPVLDRHGKVAGTTVMIGDISELKKREETIVEQRDKLQAAYEELEAANEELNASNEEYEAMNEELLETQSELLESEKRIKASLDEKELLLKEIHHRVKNNMQVITSLLHLQSQYILDERDRELFIVSENRVRSMAMVHQKIYQSPDLAKVNFGDYITELVEDLFLVYSVDRNLIRVSVNADNISLGVDLAIPCALIVNEAVTNAIKHAFPSGRSGSISIDFIADGESYTLTVNDDGQGFSYQDSEEKKETLGVQLMKALSVQLKGTFDLSSNSGTTITYVFPRVDRAGS